eukprot:3001993-Pyramimonas_sp.AAC.1
MKKGGARDVLGHRHALHARSPNNRPLGGPNALASVACPCPYRCLAACGCRLRGAKGMPSLAGGEDKAA